MATSKKGAKPKRAVEPVPTDDPTIAARWASASASVAPNVRAPIEQWIRSPSGGLARASQWLRSAIAQEPPSEATLALMLDLLPRLDEDRALDALFCVGYGLTGDHRNWLDGPRFDDDALYRDSARARCCAVVMERIDTVIAAANERFALLRAQALFTLGWLGAPARDRAVPVLQARCSDLDAVVRAAAVVALAMHGARTKALDGEEDRRVRLCATIAESWVDASGAVIDALEAVVGAPSEDAEVRWPEMPFNNGAIGAWAILRCGVVMQSQPARLTATMERALASPSAQRSIGAIVAAAFVGYAPDRAPTACQRAVASALIARAELQQAAIVPLQAARVVPMGTFETVDALIDGLRARMGIERPPPSFGSKARVAVRDRSMFAQHWMAEFAVAPEPDLAQEISTQIARALSTSELIELALLRSMDIDGSALSYDRVRSVAYPVALPEGAIEREGRIVRAPEGWPDAHRRWCADRVREGWWMVGSWWTGEEVITRWFDLRGRSLEVFFGHEWNRGDPIRTEARVVINARHRLAPLVLRAGRARDPMAFDDAIEALLRGPTGAQQSARVVQAALEVFSGTDEAPPESVDSAAVLFQRSWSYVCATIAPYARLLPEARREALAIECARSTNFALPLLYELAPTERVLEAIVPAMRQAIANWPEYVERSRASWERALGADATARIVEACGPAPAPAKPTRRRR